MEDVQNVFLTPLPEDSPYVRTFRLNYTQNGKEKNWDLLEVHDSVAVIIFNITRKVMCLVKQFRPAVYFHCVAPEDREEDFINTKKYPASLGVCLEICAGIVDKPKSLKEIAKEEVLEEVGYVVQTKDLELVSQYKAGVGTQGAIQTLFYCEVTDAMKTEKGGGVDDEIIEVVEMAIPELEAMLRAPGPHASPPSFMFALMWFLHNKADRFRKSYERHCSECKEHQDA